MNQPTSILEAWSIFEEILEAPNANPVITVPPNFLVNHVIIGVTEDQRFVKTNLHHIEYVDGKRIFVDNRGIRFDASTSPCRYIFKYGECDNVSEEFV